MKILNYIYIIILIISCHYSDPVKKQAPIDTVKPVIDLSPAIVTGILDTDTIIKGKAKKKHKRSRPLIIFSAGTMHVYEGVTLEYNPSRTDSILNVTTTSGKTAMTYYISKDSLIVNDSLQAIKGLIKGTIQLFNK